MTRGLTMRVLVMKLAIPNPCGIRSNHKWKEDVLWSHRHTDALARIVNRDETRVRL